MVSFAQHAMHEHKMNACFFAPTLDRAVGALSLPAKFGYSFSRPCYIGEELFSYVRLQSKKKLLCNFGYVIGLVQWLIWSYSCGRLVVM